MKFKSILKKLVKFIKRIRFNRVLNFFLRQLVKPFSPKLPKSVICRIPVVGTVSLRLPNSKRLYLRTDGNDGIAEMLYWGGLYAYEGDTIRLFMRLLRYSNIVFDIGASIGIYALIAAICNPTIKVYAFEPAPRSFDCLKKNVEINKLNNLYIDSSAITNYDGIATFYITPHDIPIDSSLRQDHREVHKKISVRALTIDSFVKTNNIQKIDLMKMDTEATEYKVLEGAKNVLKKDEPIIICEVLQRETVKFLNSVLGNYQYKYFWISSKGLIEKKEIEASETGDANYLFITEKKMRGVIEDLQSECFV